MLYLDNASTTQPYPEVVRVVEESSAQYWGNPSSLHKKGIEAEKLLNSSRKIIAGMLECDSEEVYFTSGGTESDNMAIKGCAFANQGRGKHIITTKIEHPAVLDSCRQLENMGFQISYLDVDAEGRVDPKSLEKEIKKETILVSVMQVNNEVGTIQPLTEIGQIIKEKNFRTLFHVDGAQGFLKVPLQLNKDKIDLYTISAHKLHGPKGVGALFVRRGTNILPLMSGGGQEKGLRSGTENAIGIAAFAKACLLSEKISRENEADLLQLRQQTWEDISTTIEGAVLNGSAEEFASPYILNLSIKGVRGEVLLHALENEGVFVSTGSACSSHKKEISSVLKAMGVAEDIAEGSIRVSYSFESNFAQVDYFVRALQNAVCAVRK